MPITTPRIASRWPHALICLLALAGLAACKEGEGSRCQVNSDCKDDLVCNKATDTCQDRANIDPDASFEPDAMVSLDAATDAAPDATEDAAPDAMPDAVPEAL